MHELIEIPPRLSGDVRNQLQQIYQYLFSVSEAMNRNLQSVGGNDLTDQEQQTMHGILGESGEHETLKDMVIKLAAYVQGNVKDIRDNTLSGDVESGRFGRYVQQTEISVAMDPGGNSANRSVQSLIRLLKEHDINIRNYVMAGEVRTGVYGVAIGKNVRTFAADGTETYNPQNKVLEIAEDGIRIYDGGDELLKITVNEENSQTIVSIEPGTGADQVVFTGSVTGDVTGDVTGNVTGDLTGDVTGDVTGNLTGDVTGDVTGNLTGDVTGDVTGNLTGDVTGDVTGNLTGDVTGNVTGDVTGNLTGDVTGDVTGDLIGDVTGDLDGIVKNKTTTETDFDDITDPGSYWVDVSGMTDGPSDLQSGDCLLEINDSGTVLRQRLETDDAIYIRRKTSGTWSNWYKFDGTAV